MAYSGAMQREQLLSRQSLQGQSSSSSNAGSTHSTVRPSRRNRLYKKRFAPKTRTGCKTCRERRVKCGEEKPVCRRCVKGDHICRYEPDKTRHFPAKQIHSDVQAFNASKQGDLQLLQSLLPVYGTAEEACYLDKFLSLTAPWLATYNDAAFFYTLLPQRSWYHPAIRHSLVALAMASERARTPELFANTSHHRWHYNQAIRHVYSANNTQEDVILLTSAIFWLHDNVTGNSQTAMVHLQGFLRILTERKARKGQKGWSESDFEPYLLRGLVFAADVAEEGLAETVEPNLIQNIRSRLRDPKYVRRFRSTDAIRDELRLGLTAIPFSSRAPSRDGDPSNLDSEGNVPISVTELRLYFEKWYRAFNAVPTISHIDRILLECHYICVALYLQVHQLSATSEPTSAVDDPQSLSRMEYVMDRLEDIDLKSIPQAPMSRDTVLPVIPILSQLIVLSKSGRIRARAFRYLRQLNRIEGMWSTVVVADMMSATHPSSGEADGASPSAMLAEPRSEPNVVKEAAIDPTSIGRSHNQRLKSSTAGNTEIVDVEQHLHRNFDMEADRMAEAIARTELQTSDTPEAKFGMSLSTPMNSLNEKIRSRVEKMRSLDPNTATQRDLEDEVAAKWLENRTIFDHDAREG